MLAGRTGEGSMQEAVIVATARTPIGRAFKGSLIDARPDDMGAFVVNEGMERAPPVTRADVADVILGCANQAGEQGVNIARNVELLANLPDTVPRTSVAPQSASSLQATRMSFHAIRAGEGDTYVAGGVESVSRLPRWSESSKLTVRFTDEWRE